MCLLLASLNFHISKYSEFHSIFQQIFSIWNFRVFFLTTSVQSNVKENMGNQSMLKLLQTAKKRACARVGRGIHQENIFSLFLCWFWWIPWKFKPKSSNSSLSNLKIINYVRKRGRKCKDFFLEKMGIINSIMPNQIIGKKGRNWTNTIHVFLHIEHNKQ